MTDFDSQISWQHLTVGTEYYVETTGYLGYNIRELIRITKIMELPKNEAMIFADGGRGFGVGGIFEGELGPNNRFWRVQDNTVKTAAAA
jgi:hypothetical protein